MKTLEQFRDALHRMDGRGYPAYRDLAGSWQMPGYVLFVDHVQGDPFAAPSSLRVLVPAKTARFPKDLFENGTRRLALEDALARQFAAGAGAYSGRLGSGKSGELVFPRPTQEVLPRSHVQVSEAGDVTVSFRAGFPANGRRIDAGAMEKLCLHAIPDLVRASLVYDALDGKALTAACDLAEDQGALRAFLREKNLAAFVADGAILPRKNGILGEPMRGAVPFSSPASLRVTAVLPHRGEVTGMGVPRGITLITGGGYHGKSTLLSALSLGVYNHAPGDGRELVVTDDTAVKVRAEDGRSVFCDDISLFFSDLPGGADSRLFSTENASGSTSEAAAIAEAAEGGANVLLLDEDTSATNLLMRDALMEQAVPHEPITPLIDRIRGMYETLRISVILAAGSFGAYFAAADTVLLLDHYRVSDITEKAKKIAAGVVRAPLPFPGGPRARRTPAQNPALLDPRTKIRADGTDGFLLGREEVDLHLVEQLVSEGQTQAIARCLLLLERRDFHGKTGIAKAVAALSDRLQKEGLSVLYEGGRGVPFLALPRRAEILAAVNRYRGLRN